MGHGFVSLFIQLDNKTHIPSTWRPKPTSTDRETPPFLGRSCQGLAERTSGREGGNTSFFNVQCLKISRNQMNTARKLP